MKLYTFIYTRNVSVLQSPSSQVLKLTVGVRVQLRIPGEGQGEKGHVTQSRKLRPLQLVAGKLERAEDWEPRESVKTFDLQQRTLSPFPSILPQRTLFPVRSRDHS